MNILVIDVGGSHVKCLVTGETEPRRFDSNPKMTPQKMVDGVREITAGWSWDVVSIGLPAPVQNNTPQREPHNLGPGWTSFDYRNAFGVPVRLINDAAMQALGSYEGGRMLFLGLGTGLGAAMILDGVIQPLELAHLPYRKRRTFEDFVGERGLDRLGMKRWRKTVLDVLEMLRAALLPDYIVLGGGNARKLDELPSWVREGSNENAFRGGFMLWDETRTAQYAAAQTGTAAQDAT